MVIFVVSGGGLLGKGLRELELVVSLCFSLKKKGEKLVVFGPFSGLSLWYLGEPYPVRLCGIFGVYLSIS